MFSRSVRTNHKPVGELVSQAVGHTTATMMDAASKSVFGKSSFSQHEMCAGRTQGVDKGSPIMLRYIA